MGCTGTPVVEAKITDGAAVVNFLAQRIFSTLKEYAEQVFLPFIDRHYVQRVDTAWDSGSKTVKQIFAEWRQQDITI